MFKTYELTKGEKIILEFLETHKGAEFTASDLEIETGIRAAVVPRIMDNLRYKGHEVCTERGKHYWPTGSWKGMAVFSAIFGPMIWIWFITFLGLLE